MFLSYEIYFVKISLVWRLRASLFFFVVVELPPKPFLFIQAMIQHLFFFFQFQLVQPFLFEKQSIAITILPWPVARYPRAGVRRLTDTPREGKVREQNILDTCVSGTDL